MYPGYNPNLYQNIPDYLTQAYPPPYDAGDTLNPLYGFLASSHMFSGPTYEMFGSDAMALLNRTPYGGQFATPFANPYYTHMIYSPMRAFFTFKVPFFAPPKGLNPAFEQQAIDTAILQGRATLATVASTLAGAEIGGRLGAMAFSGGGPFGTMAGYLLGNFAGGALGAIIGNKIASTYGRIAQVHDISSLLNTDVGGYDFGIGLNVEQSSKIYKDFAKYSVEHPGYSIREQILSFKQLAKAGLIDDSGNFTEIKSNLKKMKQIVFKLQDIFGDGDIKEIVEGLRKLRMLGVSESDLMNVSTLTSIAAVAKGQDVKDYLANTANIAFQYSQITGVNQAVLAQQFMKLDANAGFIGMYTKNFFNASSNKDRTTMFKEVLAKSFSEMLMNQDLLLSQNAPSAQQYVLMSEEAGLMAYNKKHGTHYKMSDILVNHHLRREIDKEYAQEAMDKLIKEFHGDYRKVFHYLSKQDSSFQATLLSKEKTMQAIKSASDTKEILDKYLKDILPNLAPIIDKLNETGMQDQIHNLSKLVEIVKQHPDLFESVDRMSKDKIEKNKTIEETNRLLRNTAFTTMWKKFYYGFEHFMSEIADNLIPLHKSYSEYVKENKIKAGEYLSLIKGLGIKDYKLDLSSIEKKYIDFSDINMHFLNVFKYHSNSLDYAREIISRITGHVYNPIASGELSDEAVINALQAKKMSKLFLHSMFKLVDKGDYDTLAYHLSALGESLKKADSKSGPYEDAERGLIYHSKRLGDLFQELSDEFTKTVQTIKNLNNEIETLPKDSQKRKELEKELAKQTEHLNQLKTETKVGLTYKETGLAGIYKMLGGEGFFTLGDIQEFLEAINNDSVLKGRATDDLAKKLHISRKMAAQILTDAQYSSEKAKTFHLIMGNNVGFDHNFSLLNQSKGLAKLVTGGLANDLFNINKVFKGDWDKAIKTMKEYEKHLKAVKGNKLFALLETEGNKNQLNSIAHFEESLKDIIKRAGGSLRLKVGGKEVEIKTPEDFFNKLSEKDMKKVFRAVAGIGFGTYMSEKLGININPDETIKFSKLMASVFKTSADGKIHLQDTSKMIENYKKMFGLQGKSDKDILSAINQDLRKFGLGGMSNLQNIIESLNSNNPLAKTNTLLTEIKDVLVQIRDKKQIIHAH